MRQAGLSGLIAKGRTTIRVPGAQDRLSVAEMTYMPTWEGWIKLAAFQDVFFRRIVDWGIDCHAHRARR